LPEQLEAGQISRGALNLVLSAGVGRFLGRLRAEPKLDGGRFVGWRLMSFAEGDATLRAGVLQPGDTVLRVNGQSIERPEQFKDVWDSMATSSDLVLQVERAGKQSEVRYRIVD
jgi:type II secretory pathway component PulC